MRIESGSLWNFILVIIPSKWLWHKSEVLNTTKSWLERPWCSHSVIGVSYERNKLAICLWLWRKVCTLIVYKITYRGCLQGARRLKVTLKIEWMLLIQYMRRYLQQILLWWVLCTLIKVMLSSKRLRVSVIVIHLLSLTLTLCLALYSTTKAWISLIIGKVLTRIFLRILGWSPEVVIILCWSYSTSLRL